MKRWVAAVAALTAVATGCQHGRSVAPTHAASPPVSATTSPSFDASAYARSLLDGIAVLDGEQPIEQVPAGMKRPTQTTAATDLVVATRYWRTDRAITATYRGLKSASPVGLRLSGYGSPSASNTKPPQGELDFTPARFPESVAYADVFVEVRNDAAHGSLVGAFAQVALYPSRPAAEQIPTSGISATLTRGILRHGKKTLRHTETLDGDSAASLARAVDALNVVPSALHSCPVLLQPTPVYQATLRGGGHIWTVSSSAGGCATEVAVNRNGRRLPLLLSTRAFASALARTWHQAAR